MKSIFLKHLLLLLLKKFKDENYEKLSISACVFFQSGNLAMCKKGKLSWEPFKSFKTLKV